MGNQTLSEYLDLQRLMRRLDIDITEKQAYWIKYRTWSYKKMKEKEKIFVKVEDFKMHQWQYSTGRIATKHLHLRGPRCHKMNQEMNMKR